MAIAMHLFISRDTRQHCQARALLLRHCQRQMRTCAQFVLLFFFRSDSRRHLAVSLGTKVKLMLGQAFYLHATTCQMAN